MTKDQQHPEKRKPASTGNSEPKGRTGGTTRSPADADIERVGGIRPGRGQSTSEAGGVD